MKITIVCVGKVKEKYISMAIDEYLKRLKKYVNIEIIEVSDEKAPETLSFAQKEIIKNEEGKRILKKIKDGFVIALVIDGNMLSSEKFAEFISSNMVNGISHMYFIIGGSIGLHSSVIKRADYLLSFSQMTFPHQLMRVILIEQIYRAEKIIRNEPYHK